MTIPLHAHAEDRPAAALLPLRGSAVRLRDWTAADVERYRYWQQPGHEWQAWDGPDHPRPSPEKIGAVCADLLARVASSEWSAPRQRLVIADAGTDALIGTVNWRWESVESGWGRMGIGLYDPAFWSGGRGAEALWLWTGYLFRRTPAVRLDFATWSGNLRICAVGRKLGFVEEARLRQARLVRGERYDSVIHGLLRTEWEARLSPDPSAATTIQTVSAD